MSELVRLRGKIYFTNCTLCTGVQGTHMKEVVEGGRKEVSACVGGIGVEEGIPTKKSESWF